MYNSTPHLIRAFSALYIIAQSTIIHAQRNGTDTLTTTIVSHEQWQQSTVIDYKTCETFPWTGIYDFPPDSSFTQFPVLDQPYGYVTISTIPGTSVIKSEDGVRFYRTYFNVDSLATITQCRLRVFVDDDIAIYINGTLVAQESSGTFYNYKGAPHDLMLYNFGPHHNGYNVGDWFDYVTMLQTNSFFKEGRNELLVAVRNKRNDLGGFSFRMDYDYVIDPQWVGIDELDHFANAFQVFPNPSDSWIKITTTDIMTPSSVSLYNAKGLIIYDKVETDFPLSIDLKSFPKGIYHLFIRNSHYTFTKKLIRQ